MKVAATYIFVVDVPDIPLRPDGRPPKLLADWPEDTLVALGEAVQETVDNLKCAFEEPTEVEILEHPAWGTPAPDESKG